MPASSSRRIAISVVLAAAALATAWFAGRARPAPVTAQRGRREAAQGPFLRVRLGAATAGRTDVDDDRATSLLMAGMTDPQLGALRAGLDDLAERLSVQRDPFAEDLSDEPVDRVIERWSHDHMPALTAARALAQPWWVSGDRTVSVTLAARCDGVPPEAPDRADAEAFRCIAVHGTGDSVDERARFAAWPITRAIVLRASSAEDARRGADALRAIAGESSRTALVLLDDDAQRGDRAEEARVRTAAQAVCGGLARANRPGAAPLCALGQARPGGRLFVDLDLTSRDVLVVPKLSSLAEPAQFAEEVERERVALPPVGGWEVR